MSEREWPWEDYGIDPTEITASVGAALASAGIGDEWGRALATRIADFLDEDRAPVARRFPPDARLLGAAATMLCRSADQLDELVRRLDDGS